MKIKKKLTIAFLLISLIPLLITGVISYKLMLSALKTKVQYHLKHLCFIQNQRIIKALDQNFERFSLVRSRTQLRISLERFNRLHDVKDKKKIKRIIRDALLSIKSFKNISIVNRQGRVIISTDKEKENTPFPHSHLLKKNKNKMMDMVFMDNNHQLNFYLVGILELNSKHIGFIAIETIARDLISISQDHTGLGNTGETYIAQKNTDKTFIILHPLRFDFNAAFNEKFSKEFRSSLITKSLESNVPRFYDSETDYRNRSVLAATQYIPGKPWVLISKIDKSEALEDSSELRVIYYIILLLSFIVVFVITILMARNFTKPISKLTESADLISKGELEEMIPVHAGGEIGILANAFNEMMHKINEGKKNLIQKNTELNIEIEQRKKTQEALANESAINLALAELSEVVLKSESIEEISEHVLEKCLFLTCSPVGFLGYMEPLSGHLVIPTLTGNVWDVYRAKDKNYVFKDFDGLWGRVLNNKKTLITNDVSSDLRSRGIPKGHLSIERFIGVPTMSGQELSGMIGLGNADKDYTENDALILNRLGNLYALAIQKMFSRKEVENSLKEKEILLREIHHRVKNNMALISSMLGIQSGFSKDPEVEKIFDESINRIKSLSLLHDKLYRSENFNRIDVKDYIISIVENLAATVDFAGGHLESKVEVDDIELTMDLLIPCGLIVNELVTNSLKHAFSESKEKKIFISFKQLNDRNIEMTVKDNGKGLPEDFDIQRNMSMGFLIVKSFVRQLKGDFEYENIGGAAIRITFPLKAN